MQFKYHGIRTETGRRLSQPATIEQVGPETGSIHSWGFSRVLDFALLQTVTASSNIISTPKSDAASTDVRVLIRYSSVAANVFPLRSLIFSVPRTVDWFRVLRRVSSAGFHWSRFSANHTFLPTVIVLSFFSSPRCFYIVSFSLLLTLSKIREGWSEKWREEKLSSTLVGSCWVLSWRVRRFRLALNLRTDQWSANY